MISKPSFQWSDHLLPRLILPTLLASVTVTGMIAGARSFRWLETIELNLFDQMVRLQGMEAADDRFLVVEITDADLQAFRQVPLNDGIIAAAIATLQEYEPEVIGLDIYRNIPNPPGTKELMAELAQDNVFTIYDPQQPENIPPPEATGDLRRSGFNLMLIDPDNVQRRNLLALQLDQEHNLYSFSLLIAQAYLGEAEYPVTLQGDGFKLGEHFFPTIDVNSGGYQLPNSEALGWQTLLKLAPQPNIAPSLTISDILNRNFDPAAIADKIVLIGSTAKTQKDTFTTPYSAGITQGHLTAGVYLHAQAIRQLINSVEGKDHFYRFWLEQEELIWIFLWASFGGVNTWLFYRTRLFILATGGSFAGLVGIHYGLFLANIWVPLAAPAIAFTLSWGSVLTYRLFYEERYDVLTGLPNQHSFLDQIAAVEQHLNDSETEKFIAILSIDIDRFKSINESYGHFYGDSVLKQFVRNIHQDNKRDVYVARMGANEFGILVQSPKTHEEILQLIDQIEYNLRKPFYVEKNKIHLTCSTGIALHAPHMESTPEALWRQAHTAMNRAKKSKRGNYKIFADVMQTQSIDRFTIERDLREAIENREFQLLYQPIISLKTGRLQGFEALVRWHSPTRGVVSPNNFIKIAEETDLIFPISNWVLEEGCRQFKYWQDKLHLDPRITISINLSSRQFSQTNLKEQIECILQKTALNASALKLEITESMVMDDIEETVTLLNALKSLKVKLSIDDFGTGYSSLSYLSRFPIDTLKIDRSFVDKIQDTAADLAIPNAVISLGHSLGMDIIAEGVERVSQIKILQALGCEFGQGYFFAKPLDYKDAEAFIQQWSVQQFYAALAETETEISSS